jgi:hypothetical protein
MASSTVLMILMVIFFVVGITTMTSGAVSGFFPIILVLIGFITIEVILYYFYTKALDQEKKDNANATSFPPNSFMSAVGAHCPDYWEYLGSQKDSKGVAYDVCRNSFNIPVNTSNNYVCYDDSASITKKFNPIPQWPLKNTDAARQDRCQWIKNCGPTAEDTASWTGFDSVCSGT